MLVVRRHLPATNFFVADDVAHFQSWLAENVQVCSPMTWFTLYRLNIMPEVLAT